MLEGRVSADEAVAGNAANIKNGASIEMDGRRRPSGPPEENPPAFDPRGDAADQVRANFAVQMAAAQHQLAMQQQQHLRERQSSAGGDEKVEPKREPSSSADEHRSRSPSLEHARRRHEELLRQQQMRRPESERRSSTSESLPLSDPPESEELRVEINADGKRVYICNICQFSDESKFSFHNHLATHFKEKCPLCDYITTSPERIKNHIQHMHPNKPKPGMCGLKENVLRKAYIRWYLCLKSIS